jgi:acyl carrier protein
VWVLYGPTEASIICSRQPVSAGEVPDRHVIGSRFANATLRVCDARQDPVPVGVPGEIWVGGAGVTRGYRNQPELTRERYVEKDGERYYRTGDVGRFLADGTLEFLGRNDAQVKVRGFRIELAEVELALCAHPGVREAVAGVRPDAGGGPRLVAWVVPACPDGFEPLDILAELRRRVPEYMVPSLIMAVASLPVTANGKVDRQALPEPVAGRQEDRASYVAPRSEPERVLAALFAEALGLEKVGVHDDFFALGGHSLTATRLVAAVREAVGRDLPLRRLFEAPTVAGLARSLEEAAVPAVSDGEPPLAPVARGEGDLMSLLAEIEQLPDHDVRALLESPTGSSPQTHPTGDLRP